MNLNNAKNLIYRNLVNFKGWHTNRKIIVFESDDWGMIRMPSKTVLDSIPTNYKKYYNSPYYQLDTIADSDDLQYLFELLSKHKDKNGRPAVLTANTVVANPDFKKIVSDNYKQYYFETIDQTITNYYSSNVFNLWFEGIKDNVFFPQLHAREHVDIVEWMQLLQSGNEVYIDAFQRGIYCVDYDIKAKKKNLTAVFDYSNQEEINKKKDIIIDAIRIFDNLFGYKPVSFIAPSYTWDDTIENILNKEGIKFIQGIRVQKYPRRKRYEYTIKTHYTGQMNKNKQLYLIRNVFYEPSLLATDNIVESTLKRIKIAFLFKQPVIIGTHRINYVGAINKKNRDRNLRNLDRLLKTILKTWPNVEFLTTAELGALISSNK